MRKQPTQQGLILLNIIVFGSIAVMLITALVVTAVSTINVARNVANQEQAFQIAEAGIEYYRWHLAHAPTDYTDGTGSPGPYVHEYFDRQNNKIGEFALTIEPPPIGSTIVTITATGTVVADSNISRAIRTHLAIPSLARFAVAANSDMRFGEGTVVFGPIHSNGGIRFDGLAHNVVSSAVEDYNDPDHSGGNEFGVHTHVSPTDPLPPATVPLRPDVFEAGRQFPIPAVDFVGISTDLASIKSNAQSDGYYYANSGALGYRIVLRTDDTFDIYRVNNVVNSPGGCSSSQTGWGTWSVNSQTFLSNNPLPANGLIFVEDHVWVEGQIDGARITIASGRFPDNPSTRTNITVNNDLLYTNYDGSDVIGLISQNNFNIGMVSQNSLRIDAAIIAQNGRVGRHHYSNKCNPYHQRDEVTLYGMIATSLRYGFAYTDDTGYADRYLNYDANLLYGPPPSFPLTSDQYVTISWEEVK
ncbi:MAG: hypothetical protein WDZ88_02100 [Candidatus Paceibacterota bacterium]